MDESENLEYLNKLAVSIAVSYGNVYLVSMLHGLLACLFAKSMNVMIGLFQGVSANLDIMQVHFEVFLLRFFSCAKWCL